MPEVLWHHTMVVIRVIAIEPSIHPSITITIVILIVFNIKFYLAL